MPKSVTLLSLNCEGEKHLDRILPFLRQELPDIACLQEIRDTDLPFLEEALGAPALFCPMSVQNKRGEMFKEGIAIISRHPVAGQKEHYYVSGADTPLPLYDGLNDETKQETQKFVVLQADIAARDTVFSVATTHFPWSAEGNATDFQRASLAKLLKQLEGARDLVLCGDFNAPRGREIFSALANRFADNVPPEITTSIDATFHRAGALELMVDGMFSCGRFRLKDVRLRSGLSDHLALTGSIFTED